MSTRSTAIARGVVLQVAAKFSALPLAMVTLAISTRYLGPEGYGVMAAAVVFVTTFEALSELGVGTVIVRRVAGRGASLDRLVGLNLSFSAIYALPLASVAAIAGVGLYWGEIEQQLAVLVVALGLVFTTLSSCFEPVFDVRVRYSSTASAEFFSRVLTLSAAASVAHFDLGLLPMCAVQILPQALRLAIEWWGASRLATIRWQIAPAEMWSLLKESFPITVIAIIGVLYWRADGLILSIMSTGEQVGGYYAALQIAFTLAVVAQVFERSVLSTVNEAYHADRRRFAHAIDRGYRFLLLVGLPIAIVGWPLAGRLIEFVAEEEFRRVATVPLQLFFVAVALTFLAAIVSDGLIAAHEQRFLTTLSTINLGINIVGNVLLIPSLGAVACGIMLITTETVGVLASQWRLRRHGVGPLPFGYIARLVPAGLLALGAIWLTYDLPLVVPAVAGGLAYLVGAFLVGAIPASMREALLGALRPRSLDRMEAEGAAVPLAEGDEPGAEAVPSRPLGKGARGPDAAPDAPHRTAGSEGDLDAPTTELDVASLQTTRMRVQRGHVVELRVVRRP